jgi:hypothetical protein
MACFLNGTEFIIFGGEEKLACEVMFSEGSLSSSPVKEGFSLAGKKANATGMNIASKQTRNMDSYLSYDICTQYYSKLYIEKKTWDVKKVGKGKTPSLRVFFAWHYECKTPPYLLRCRPETSDSWRSGH